MGIGNAHLFQEGKMSANISHNELKKKLLKPNSVEVNNTLNSLISLATKGHLPLFHDEWIHEAVKNLHTKKKMNIIEAKRKVNSALKKLDRHRQIDRKKTALFQMSTNERNELIEAFLQIVEGQTLDNLKELH